MKEAVFVDSKYHKYNLLIKLLESLFYFSKKVFLVISFSKKQRVGEVSLFH